MINELSMEVPMNETRNDIVQLVTFMLGDEEYGIDILSVQEILRMVEITQVPKSQEVIEGVINLRGRVIPVLDMRKKFGLPETDDRDDRKIMVINVGGLTAGIVVDSVSEVLRLPAENIDETPAMVSGGSSEFIKGVGKLDDRLIILLDLERLITTEELQVAA